MNKFKWYAVHTLSQSENKVKTLIENTKQKFNVADSIGEIIIPMDIEVKKTNGKTVEKQTKVFPGYVMIKMILDENTFNFKCQVF